MEKKKAIVVPVLALIFGLASFFTSFIAILGILFGIVAIVLSIICFRKKSSEIMLTISLISASLGIIISGVIFSVFGIAVGMYL